jgi:hypothetical protein
VGNPVRAVTPAVRADDPAVPHRKTLEQLRCEAIVALESRGYDIRGKTPAQIRKILKRRSKSQKSNA